MDVILVPHHIFAGIIIKLPVKRWMGFTMHNSKSFFDKKFGKTAFTWLISVVFIFSNFATVFANSVSPLELRDETNPGAQESFQENIEDFPTTDIESTSAYEDGLNLSGTFINKDQYSIFINDRIWDYRSYHSTLVRWASNTTEVYAVSK